MKRAMEMKEFPYETLKQLHRKFIVTGLTVNEFDCLFKCVESFFCAIVYPDCKESETHLRKLDKQSKLLCFYLYVGMLYILE